MIIDNIRYFRGKAYLYGNGERVVLHFPESIQNHNISIGLNISEKQLSKLLKQDFISFVKSRLFDLFSRRDRSRLEVSRYIGNQSFKKGIKLMKAESDDIINYFNERGLLNDYKFAEQLVESKLRNTNYSLKQIQIALLQKGIDSCTIQSILAKVENSQFIEKSLKLAQRRWNRLKGTQTEKVLKLKQYLLQRGFDWNSVKETIDRMEIN